VWRVRSRGPSRRPQVRSVSRAVTIIGRLFVYPGPRLVCLFALVLIGRNDIKQNVIGINNCDNWRLNNVPIGGNGLFLNSDVIKRDYSPPIRTLHKHHRRRHFFIRPIFPFISRNPRVHISRHCINSPATFPPLPNPVS
jgi:hypothetical protein